MLLEAIHRAFARLKQPAESAGASFNPRWAALHRIAGMLCILILIGTPFGMTAYAVPVQNAATGTFNGSALDITNATVTLDRIGGAAVTSAVAEIDPNNVAVSSAGNIFTYDILPTINAGDTGVDELSITAPAGYSGLNVTAVSVGGTAQSLDCALDNANEYCVALAGQVMTITLRDKVTVSGTNIRITFSADAPGAAGSADFTSTVDDTSTGAASQSTIAGDADGDAADNNSITVLVSGNAVTSAVAEISPNSVAVGSAGNNFTYNILPTVNVGDTGINEIAITAPAGYANLNVTGVSVGGAPRNANCAPGPLDYCVNIVGQVITVELGANAGSDIQITFDADAPGVSGSGDFTSTVDDNTTINVPQSPVAGNADGDATDNNSITVLVYGSAVTSAVAEISPNGVSVGAVGNVFTYDILPVVNAGDTGVNEVVITSPAGYANLTVTNVSVGGLPYAQNCAVPVGNQYCATIAGQVIIVELGNNAATNIQTIFTADAPGVAGSADFTSTVDDNATPSFVPQNTVAGNADGDAADANSITVNVAANLPDINYSTVTADPIIVIANGVSVSTVTTTLRNASRLPVPGKNISLSSDRGAADIITQPAAATDGNGVATGSVSSNVVGVATITSTDTTDGIPLSMRPVIYFTQGRVLEITKTANKKEAVVGDVVTYLVEIRNLTINDVVQTKVYDQIPPNFKYIKGSARLNGNRVSDPSGNRPRIFTIGTVPALVDSNGNGKADHGEQGYMTLSYQLIIGSGAAPGEYENTAVTKDVCDRCLLSNYDTAEVTVTLDPLFDLGTIIGKVFEDRNEDGWQDEGEGGIAGAMVALDDGTYALTDEHGRYHFPAVKPGHRLVKINLLKLPIGAAATTREARVVSVTPGLLAKANFGVTYKYDEENIGREKQLGLSMSNGGGNDPVHVVGSARNMAIIINGKMASIHSGLIRMNVEGVHDIVDIKGNTFDKPVEFSLVADSPDDVTAWKVIILDSDEMIVRTLSGSGPPPGSVHWDGLTDSGQMITGGKVYQYQYTVEYSDGSRVASARKLFGVNKTSIISLSLTGGAFRTGSIQLADEAKSVLKEAADVLRAYPDEKVMIEGHADSTGSEKTNMELSKNRAEAAVTYLVDTEGISRDRFMVKWYGESKPIATNAIPEGRELNRRVEVRGEIQEIDEAKLYDQYRTEPEVRINGSSVFVDSYGRFSTNVDDSDTHELDLYVRNAQGRTVETQVKIPSLEIIEPRGDKVMPYGSEGDQYRMLVSSEKEMTGKDETLMAHQLAGRTEPGNVVELDGIPLTVESDGTFRAELALHAGRNAFGLVAQTPDGYSRIANLIVEVSDRDEDGKYVVAVTPEPYLTVKLPPKGAPLRDPELPVSGSTDPDNVVRINGKPVTVQPDGSFSTIVELPRGVSRLEIEATDPEGYRGSIEREVEVGGTSLFFLAFIDGKVGYLKGEGYLEGAGMDESEDYFTEGRVAFYLKGYVKGKYLVTAAFDTGTNEFDEMFEDLDDAGHDRLFTNLDPDKLYPVYGDSSTIVYDTESQGKLYLAIESEELHALVGNYRMDLNDTELATYNRTLYGGRVAYRSVSRTKYGAPDTEVVVFGAEVRQAHVRDELKATGGSLYYLSHTDVIEGSEQVTLVIRDKNTGLIVSRTPQEQNLDYEIKYDEGRVLFRRPISSVVEDDELIDRALLAGNPVSIQVDYETELESFEKTGYGGRIRKQIGDHVALGGTYVNDELTSGSYELQGLDTEIRLGKNTRFIAEYAESSGTDSVVFRSDDGGLTYTEETPAGTEEGVAWKVAAEIDIGEWFGTPDRFQAGGYYKKLESGFLSSGNFIERGTEKSGVNLKLHVTEPDTILARYDREEFEGSGTGQTERGTVQFIHDKDWWKLTGEYQIRESKDDNGDVTDSSSFGALRLDLAFTDTFMISAEHQQTFTGEENDQTTLGVEYRLFDTLSLSAEGTTGTKGQSAQGGAVLQLGNKRLYVMERVADDDAGGSVSTVIGSEASLDSGTRVYTEYQWKHSESDRQNMSVIGAQKNWDITKGLKLVVSGEHTDVDSGSSESSRYSLAAGLSYAINGLKASTRNEIRKEEGDDDRVQYLTSNMVDVKLSPDFTLLGKIRYSLTVDESDDSTEAEFNESSVGIAFRPVAFDRFNALARYTHISDQRPLSQGDMESSDITTDVASVEWSLDITRNLEWVEKGALKVKEEKTGDRPSETTHTYLLINRVNLNVWRTLDIGLEYRILAQEEADDRRQGWLTEVMWEAVKHVRLGMGYNFTDFSDNEFSDNDYSVQGWFVRVQATY